MTDMDKGQSGFERSSDAGLDLDSVDTALAALKQDVFENSPRPGPDLVAQVLADASEVASGAALSATGVAGVRNDSASTGTVSSIWEGLFGWTSGAVAALAVSLALGIGIGMELEPGDLPMTEADEEIAMLEGGLLQDDFL